MSQILILLRKLVFANIFCENSRKRKVLAKTFAKTKIFAKTFAKTKNFAKRNFAKTYSFSLFAKMGKTVFVSTLDGGRRVTWGLKTKKHWTMQAIKKIEIIRNIVFHMSIIYDTLESLTLIRALGERGQLC
jgi:hypothetical protein